MRRATGYEDASITTKDVKTRVIKRRDIVEVLKNPDVTESVKKDLVENWGTTVCVRVVVVGIVMVVLGIAGAIAVDNWNNDRKEAVCYSSGGYYEETDGVSDTVTCSGVR